MSKRIHTTSLTIVRSTHLSRDAVLFTLVSLASVVFYPDLVDTYALLMWLIIDSVGLVFLWIPRETWQQVGYGWGGLMSIALLLPVFTYSGTGYFVGGIITILCLCIIELLAILKAGYDFLIAESQSWTSRPE